MVLLRSDTNDYPLPLLTSVGTLDGGGVSSAVVEWRQSRANPSGNGQPVLMIEEVNHLQVSDGVYDDPVTNADTISRDIDPVVSDAEAHKRYAAAAVSHMVTAPTTAAQFAQEVVDQQAAVFADLSAYTGSHLTNLIQCCYDANSSDFATIKCRGLCRTIQPTATVGRGRGRRSEPVA